MSKGGHLCLDSKDACEVLNEYFALVFMMEKDMETSEISVECINVLGPFKGRMWWCLVF